MKRRTLLTATVVALSGCTASGGAEQETTQTESAGVMDPEYLGVHDEHDGPPVDHVRYEIHNACKATIFVWFADKPAAEDTLIIWFYKDDEQVEVGSMPVGDDEFTNRETFPFQFCQIAKYDAFRVGVVSE